MRILVVDDDADLRSEMADTLVACGFEVEEASDARAAVSAARRRMPDAVVMDLILPDARRFDLLQRLRRLPGGADLWIVAVSGFPTALAEARFERVGFDGFLTKPFGAEELARALDRRPGSRSP